MPFSSFVSRLAHRVSPLYIFYLIPAIILIGAGIAAWRLGREPKQVPAAAYAQSTNKWSEFGSDYAQADFDEAFSRWLIAEIMYVEVFSTIDRPVCLVRWYRDSRLNNQRFEQFLPCAPNMCPWIAPSRRAAARCLVGPPPH